ncbi:MAG TPA: hypothetical protein VFO65_13190 [Acidimicrobiales bacterium]|nr:hypothetical protein [Acidimicrobiales bacterium]
MEGLALGLVGGKDGQVRRSRHLLSRAVLVVMALVASGSACDNADGSNGTGATVPEDTTTTSTTAAPIDITTRPDVITLDYANAMMAELDRLHTEAIAAMVAEGVPNKEFYDKLNAVYDDPAFEFQQSVYGEAVADGVEEFRNPPGPLATRAERLIRSDPDCVLFAVDRDFSAFLAAPRAEESNKGFIALAPKGPGSDPAAHNPTPWSIVLDGDTQDGNDPEAPC